MPQAYQAVIDAWAAKTQVQLMALGRQSIQQLCEDVSLNTPVHIGFLRGGWQPSWGNVPPPRPNASPDPSGAIGMADVVASLLNFELGETFYYTNAVAYARRIEYGFVGEDSLGRHYNQAGRFYLGNQVARWQEIVNAQAAVLWGTFG